MSQLFGDFSDLEEHAEYLVIGFSPTSIPLKQRWRNNGLSADFIADYLQTFFVGDPEKRAANNNSYIPAKSKNAVKYIANELLENAMKFNNETASFPTKIAFHLFSSRLIFQVVNSVNPDDVERFQGFIKQLLNEDPQELYIQQMEANASSENSKGHSGLGFLSMICDYSAKLSWKFDVVDENPPITIVTTRVALDVS
ncbi:DUF6272 family protein [Beggiatoa leptomitoformis]|uniref:ATP-binding protein n=1 Tax=Beggiatoa leptomitoformis TaxID=288004 RepID=A0A2N9YBS8_9GAMM|nr:DUF6272 family protein [Beggiatoa leptomitoformis]ALG66712.1 ATP-binding protein [Beggiatoa leptomitoformis]AUI67957.1 ATP-binding protein [Beggiatoa leptomitoformis]